MNQSGFLTPLSVVEAVSALKKLEVKKTLGRACSGWMGVSILLILILPLLVAIPILTTRAMTEVKNGITRSNPFPWFLPDTLICILLILLLFQFAGINCWTLAATIIVLLIVLFELSANHRFIDQLSLDTMSAQQSHNQQTSTDQPLSPGEMKQPATDPEMEPSNEKTTPTQTDERSARELEQDAVLKVVKHIIDTIPNIEPITISRIIDQHSNSSKTPVSNIPIPRRARIPLKTLLILAAGLLITTWILSSDLHLEQSEWRSLGIFVLLIALLISAIPVVIALKGMQIIHDRWFVLSLPLLIIAPPALFGLARLALEEESTELAFFAALVISLSTFIAAVIADDVAS